ncbi:hypothetical protein [Novosphingobium sp. BL-8A]|uniref:hypothetical protein n=1 Tax=Novosphingobium sp. BL-8A TaxID=3127639 RepID=UPI003757A601
MAIAVIAAMAFANSIPAMAQDAQTDTNDQAALPPSPPAQATPAPATPSAAMPGYGIADFMRTFAGVGIIGEMNSSETYGAVQQRIGQYTAHAQAAQYGDDLSHVRDNATSYVVPAHVTFELPGDGNTLLKVGGAAIYARGNESAPTDQDSDGYNFLAEVLRRIAPNQAIGVGFATEVTDVDLKDSGGHIDSRGTGVRLDYVNRLSPTTGLAVRAIVLDGRDVTGMPGIPTARQKWRRYFTEAKLMKTLDHRNAGFVPEGWFLRPAVEAVYQASRGYGSNPAEDENYGFVEGSLRLEKQEFRNWHFAPYVEAGLIREFVQDISPKGQDAGNDPTVLYSKIGGSTRLGGHGRLDLYYARRDGAKGIYNQQTINLLISIDI